MEILYIEYLNKEKNFNKDEVQFEIYDEAVKWGRKNLENFLIDMIKYKDISISELNNQYKNSRNNYKVAGESHLNFYKETHPVRDNALSQHSKKVTEGITNKVREPSTKKKGRSI
jgi:hypothetical protein